MPFFAFAVAPSGLICPLGSQLGDGWQGRVRPVVRLAIAKDFLAEYAKLDKGAQSAVDAAVAKFAKQAGDGPYLETPRHSRDNRIRTIRIDSIWRGVVLAPDTGDTYCLITVLPHEKANAFAASHRFSVNQALGVLEVRDEDAIRQLEPSLPVAASMPGGCSLMSATPT